MCSYLPPSIPWSGDGLELESVSVTPGLTLEEEAGTRGGGGWVTPSEGVVAIKGEFDGLDSIAFVSFDTIRTSFSPSADEGVGFDADEEPEEGKGVDEPTLTTLAVVVEMKEESVERREDTNGFSDVLMLLVKGVTGKWTCGLEVIATSPGTPPIGATDDDEDGEEVEEESGEIVEVGNFTRFVGFVLNFRRDGVE